MLKVEKPKLSQPSSVSGNDSVLAKESVCEGKSELQRAYHIWFSNIVHQLFCLVW